MRQFSPKKFKQITRYLSVALLLSGCQFQQNASVRDDVLVFCSEGSPETFNPQLSTSGVTFDASSRTLYNRLVEFKSGTTSVIPALATSWKISEDGKEYTFKLRKNVYFHTTEDFTPKRPFNADDVLFSFHRQWNKTHPFHNNINYRYRYFESMGLGNLIQDIIKVDDYTIKFSLVRPESPFLATLAMDFASILSAEYGSQLVKTKNLEAMDLQPVGTGPFQLVRYQPDAFIRYKAHPEYWQGEQKLKKLVFAITPDPSLRFARLVAGECDVMANPLPVHLTAAHQFKNTLVQSEAGLNIAFLTMNTRKPPFNNLQVRIALNHAINKKAIIKAVYQKMALPAITPIPPNIWAHNGLIKDFDYDPEKAKALLKSAGYPQGFKMDIWTMSAQREYNPDAKKMAELIQQNLKDVGIEVEIETYEYGAFLDKVRRGEHHAALMGWISDNGDPDNFFTPLLSCAATLTGTNSSFWCDQKFNKIIHQASSKMQTSARRNLYYYAQEYFKAASPWVPIAHARQHIILNPRVKNFKMLSNGGVYFNNVYLQKSEDIVGEHE